MSLHPLRIAMYSHDAMGIGHVRRNLLIARALSAGGAGHATLLISGIAEAAAFYAPPGIDFLTLPSLRKEANGAYRPRRLAIPPAHLLAVRSATIEAALGAFDPDVFVVDKLPRGVGRELDAALARLRHRGRARCVLGLRDVLDDAASVREEWGREGNEDFVAAHYDAVWVYGSPAVYDLVREYGLRPNVARKVRYTGYLDRRSLTANGPWPGPLEGDGDGDGSGCVGLGSSDETLPDEPFVLCLLGSGEDGEQLATAFVDAERPPGLGGVLLAGPFMPPDICRRLCKRARLRPGMQVLRFSPHPHELIRRASRVVAMGGYNTVWEILSYEKPALIVPRVSPRQEQRIRAERLRDLGLVDVLDPSLLNPAAISEWVGRDVPPVVSTRSRLDMNGLARLPQLLEELMSAPRGGNDEDEDPANAPSAAVAQPAGRCKRLRVGYLVKRYPRYSETFVVTEILAHEAAGLEVEIFALGNPLEPHFQDAIARVRAPVTYLTGEGVRAPDFWAAIGEAAAELPEVWDHLRAASDEPGREVYQAVQLARAVRARGVDHLHAHFASAATTVARLAARLAGVPFTFTAHAKDIFHADVRPDDLRRKLADAAAVVTVSDYNARHLRETFGGAAAGVTRVYNGLDLERLPFDPPARRAPLVAAVGRLVEKKGFGDLIDACAILAERGRSFRCAIVGTGELEPALRAQVRRLGLEDRVELRGARPQPDVFRLLRSAAALAAPCLVGTDENRDGLPTVLLEAMACGTPCVSTDVTGIPEVLRDEETGLSVPQRDPAALADALDRLLEDSPLRVRLATAARALVEREFDTRRNTARLRELFAAAANAGAKTPVNSRDKQRVSLPREVGATADMAMTSPAPERGRLTAGAGVAP